MSKISEKQTTLVEILFDRVSASTTWRAASFFLSKRWKPFIVERGAGDGLIGSSTQSDSAILMVHVGTARSLDTKQRDTGGYHG